MVGNDAQPTARWRDDFSTVRPSIAIYDLIDAENVRAREIAGAVDGDDMTLAKVLSSRRAPTKIINELLRLSNIPVEISVKESDQIIASKSGGAPYSIAELSDGERSALLVAATVLTAKPGTLILIDEPEAAPTPLDHLPAPDTPLRQASGLRVRHLHARRQSAPRQPDRTHVARPGVRAQWERIRQLGRRPRSSRSRD